MKCQSPWAPPTTLTGEMFLIAAAATAEHGSTMPKEQNPGRAKVRRIAVKPEIHSSALI